MRGWILDTNVPSELRKRRCDANVRSWVEAQPHRSLYLSRVSVAEFRYGAEQARDAGFRRELVAWLDGTLLPWFEDRILDIDEPVLVEWRRMVERSRLADHMYVQRLLIAATAAVHGLGVATRNVGDFEKAGVGVVNPWRQDAP